MRTLGIFLIGATVHLGTTLRTAPKNTTKAPVKRAGPQQAAQNAKPCPHCGGVGCPLCNGAAHKAAAAANPEAKPCPHCGGVGCPLCNGAVHKAAASPEAKPCPHCGGLGCPLCKGAAHKAQNATAKNATLIAKNATVTSVEDEDAEDKAMVEDAADEDTPKNATANATGEAEYQAQALLKALTPTAKPASHHNTTRVKVDVGFAEFQTSLFQDLDGSIREGCKGKIDGSLLDGLVANVSSSVKAGMALQFAKVKKNIGGTWMALPEDEQKNKFVHDAKVALTPVFANSLGNVKNHVKLYTNRLENLLNGHKSKAVLAQEAAKMLSDSLLKKHCFKDVPKSHKKKNKTALLAIKKRARNTTGLAGNREEDKDEDEDDSEEKDPPGEFCMDSLISALARRLQDAESLVGMGMRFENNAMQGLALIQLVN